MKEIIIKFTLEESEIVVIGEINDLLIGKAKEVEINVRNKSSE